MIKKLKNVLVFCIDICYSNCYTHLEIFRKEARKNDD
jgi:hypothetical protein